ncbi:MAG: Lipopolysaccharide assembly protein B [Gammaproteobacteria bacterium]|nr:Lipopolysaccharide assembly protein B [Gammaproteobacteria bacterium]
MFDATWLLLLLPAAAATGWYLGRRDRKNETSFNLPSAYFQGLNFLLNEQPDKAIEVFLKMLEVDSETVEMHLALGNLFRRRGEIERATRIHQNLIARPNLEEHQRLQALFQLAQDYLRAGLLDRAESLLLELIDVDGHAESALRLLKDIYEQESEWGKAVDILKRLERIQGSDMHSTIAQYYCQLAEERLTEGCVEEGEAYVRRALDTDAYCTRARIQQGLVRHEGERYREARKAWSRIQDEDIWCLISILDRVVHCYRALHDQAGLDRLLNRILERVTNPHVLIARVNELERMEGPEAATSFLEDWLVRHPSVAGLARLMELERDANRNGDNNVRTRPVRTLLDNLMDTEGSYRCRQCGFTGRTLYWHCPGCKSWNSQHPLSGPELLASPN